MEVYGDCSTRGVHRRAGYERGPGTKGEQVTVLQGYPWQDGWLGVEAPYWAAVAGHRPWRVCELQGGRGVVAGWVAGGGSPLTGLQ